MQEKGEKKARAKGTHIARNVSFIGIGILILVVFFFSNTDGKNLSQPLQFSHQAHVEVQKQACETCHRYFKTREVAGKPAIAICMECHTNPVSKSPEEEKLRRIADTLNRLDWLRVTRVPPHVRFSHKRHIVVAKLACETCHGDIAKLTAPPTEPLIQIGRAHV